MDQEKYFFFTYQRKEVYSYLFKGNHFLILITFQSSMSYKKNINIKIFLVDDVSFYFLFLKWNKYSIIIISLLMSHNICIAYHSFVKYFKLP